MQSPFLAISHTVDVILLNIANVFQIRSALAGFKEIAVGLESFSFCSVEEREGERERVQLPQDWFGTPTWPPFRCFGTLV